MKRDDDQVDSLKWALRGRRTLAEVPLEERQAMAQRIAEQAERLGWKFAEDFFNDAPRPSVVFDGGTDKVIEGEYTVVRPLLSAPPTEGEDAP